MKRLLLFGAFISVLAIPAITSATVCNIFNGCTGTGTTPAYGQLLIGGKNGEYEYVASSTFSGGSGSSGFSTTSTAYWFTQQTTAGLAEGSNLYFTNARAVSALTGQNVSIFANDAGYVTSSFSTTSASYFLSVNQGAAFSTTSANYLLSTKGYITSAASTTLLGDANTFSGVNKFTNASSDFGGTWQTFSPSHFQTALAFTWPLINTAGTISFNGLSTTTNLTAGHLVESSGAGSITDVATSSGTVSSPLTGNFICIGSGCTLGVQAASASQNGYLAASDYSLLHTATTTFSGVLSYSNSTNAVTCPTCLTANQTITISGAVSGSGTTAITAEFASTTPVEYGGTASTTLGGILAGNGTAAVKSAVIGTGLSFDGTTLSNSGVTSNSGDWAGTWQTFSPSHFQTALGFTPVPNTRNMNTTYPLQGGGALSGDLTLSTALSTTTQNAFNALNTFTNSTSTELSAGTLWLTGITGSVQCLHVDTNGKVTGTGSDCGTGSGGVTSLSATYPIQTTGSTGAITVSSAFSTTTANAFSALNTFANATSTLLSAGTLWDTGLASVLLAANANGQIIATSTIGNNLLQNNSLTVTAASPLTGGGTPSLGGSVSVGCQPASGSQAGCLSSADWSTFNGKDGFGWPFTPQKNYGVQVNATSTPLYDTAGLMASSTSYFDDISVGTTTATSSFAGPLILGTSLGNSNFLGINCVGNFPASVTTGGCANITDSGTGPALIVDVSGNGTNGRGISFDCTSSSFGDNCFNLQSPETGSSILNLQGAPNGLGTEKIGANGAGNSNSSLLSMDAHLSGFQGMALFMKCSGVATSTGNCWQTLDADSNTIFDLMNNGNFGIATGTPGSLLSIASNINFTNATSTFYNGGINLLNGCFSVNGTCITGGGGSGTVTQVNTTYPVTGGPFTTSGTIGLAFGTTTANTWSALNLFSAGASTTEFSAFGPAYFGGSATSSFSTTGALTLATPLTPANGGTGATSLTGLITTADLASANVSQFTNDAGYLTSAGAVTSLSGTANQITASGSVGAVTLSFPSLLKLGQASSTLFSAFGPAYFGGSATSSFSTAGALTLATPLSTGSGGTGSANLGSGVVEAASGAISAANPTRAFVIGVASTTPLTGTTTSPAFSIPIGMTVTSWACTIQPAGATAEVEWQYANPTTYTTATPTYLAASSTPGTVAISSNNTPAALATSTLSVGNPSATALSGYCSFVGNSTTI